MKGFTPKLQCPGDLLEKLKWDLRRLEESSSDVYAAFDFFVTAEHIPDWINDKSIKKGNDLLMVVSHVANGAKHFEVSKKRHKSVTEIELRTDPWPDESGVSGEHIREKGTREKGTEGLNINQLHSMCYYRYPA